MKSTHTPAVLATIFACLIPAHSRGEGVVVQWDRTYNNPGVDLPRAVAVDSQGAVIVTGISRLSDVESSKTDIYTAKYDAANGELLWSRRYDGPSQGQDDSRALAVDRAGNAIIAGYAWTNTGWSDGYAAKYAAATGTLIWEKLYAGPANRFEEFRDVALDSADNVIVTGRAATFRSEGVIRDDIYTAKYAAADGELLWEMLHSPSDDPLENHRAEKVVVDSGDNVIIAGYTVPGPSGDPTSITLVKYAAANGALVWSVSRDDMSFGTLLAVDAAGNVIVSAIRTTAKYDAVNGALLWERQYNGAGGEASNLNVDNDGNVVLTTTGPISSSNSIIYRVKYASQDGAMIGEHRNAAATGVSRSLVTDLAGNVITTGTIGDRNTNTDIVTAKYRSEDLALLWEIQYNGTENINDQGIAVVVDESGNVIVTGQTNSSLLPPLGGRDYYTVKYAPVDLDLDDDGLLDSWEIEHFGGTAGQSALDDTDGDGAVELLELAFATDPRASHSVPAPAVVIEDGYLTTTIMKQACVRYLVETGALLESGFSATSTTVLTDDATTLKVRDNVPVSAQAARFLRVQVTADP